MYKIKENIKINLIFVCLFFLLIPGIVSIFTPGLSGDSNIELRNLQDFPEISANVRKMYKWPRRFDQFSSDRFPFRSFFINKIGSFLFKKGISISPEVIIAKNGWLFLRKNSDVLDKYLGVVQLSDDEIKDWINKYIERKKLIHQIGAQLFFVIIPNKHTIYPEYLPDYFHKVRPSLTDQLVSGLREVNVEGIIDLRPALILAKKEQDYNKYNTHWNDYGAYLGYLEIMKYIPSIFPISGVDIGFSKNRKTGDLARMLCNPELTEFRFGAEIKKNNILYRRNFENKGKYQTEEWLTKTIDTNDQCALFLCDSFTNGVMYKFLEQTFGESIFKHHNRMEYDPIFIKNNKPDFVFYIVAERLIPHELLNNSYRKF